MSTAELDRLIIDASGLGFFPMRDLLRYLRKERVRRPDLVVKYCSHLLTYAGRLGDELWVVYEQALVAALDCADYGLANTYLAALNKKFPKSQRVGRLEGMVLEAGGKYSAALDVYNGLVEQNPANSLARKRQVAVLIAQGKTAAAVKALNAYLAEFAADMEGWLQLAKLHIGASNYEAAIFCYEELVLASPSDPLLHCRLGELYYTQGGAVNLMRARKHLSQSVDLKKVGNARALHGLCQACVALASKSATKGLAQGKEREEKEREVNAALHLFATNELRKTYSSGDPALAATGVNEMMPRLNLFRVALGVPLPLRLFLRASSAWCECRRP
ncbi:unnamed protein product [Discosporangium mesarthrocarpum]